MLFFFLARISGSEVFRREKPFFLAALWFRVKQCAELRPRAEGKTFFTFKLSGLGGVMPILVPEVSYTFFSWVPRSYQSYLICLCVTNWSLRIAVFVLQS